MTTDSTTTTARGSAVSESDTASAGSGQGESLWQFLWRQKTWLLLLVLYFCSWFVPFRFLDLIFYRSTLNDSHSPVWDGILYWCAPRWLCSNSTSAFQPFVPFAVGLLIWSRRDWVYTEWRKLAQRYPSADHPKRHGNPIVFLIGCVGLVFAYCVQVKGVAVGAQLIIALGILYWVFGLPIMRKLFVYLWPLVLMIPPPDTILEKIGNVATAFSASKSAWLMTHLLPGYGVQVEGSLNGPWFIHTNRGAAFEVSPFISDGAGPMVSAAAFILWYCWYRRVLPVPTVLMTVFSVILALLINIIRLIVVTVVIGPLPKLAALLIGDSSFNHFVLGWLIAAAACLFAWLLTLLCMSLMAASPGRVKTATVRIGLGMDAAAKPLDAALTFSGKRVGSLWSRSERALESLLKKLFPRKRRRSRHSSSGRRRY